MTKAEFYDLVRTGAPTDGSNDVVGTEDDFAIIEQIRKHDVILADLTLAAVEATKACQDRCRELLAE